MNDTDKAFAFHMRRLRTACGWSYRELSLRSGAAHSLLWRAEHGQGVTLRHAAAIADALGVPLPLMLNPAACEVCADAPPQGFICGRCGRERKSDAERAS